MQAAAKTSRVDDAYGRLKDEIRTDLERRVHRNQSTKALGKMAFAILKTFITSTPTVPAQN